MIPQNCFWSLASEKRGGDERINKTTNTLGCCGIDCGLCPRFYTVGSSRCPGCCGEGFESLHPSCSFATCCAKNKKLEVCAECGEFPCKKFENEKVERDSFVTHGRIYYNQSYIKSNGLSAFLDRQKSRMCLLRKLIEQYDDGRRRSFFCLACALLSLESLEKALERVKDVSADDKKSRAKYMKDILNQLAAEDNVELKLRKL